MDEIAKTKRSARLTPHPTWSSHGFNICIPCPRCRSPSCILAFSPCRGPNQMGGGISSLNGQLLARRCDVRNNAAARDGGGLRLSYETTAVLNACHVSSNTGERIHEKLFLTWSS